MSEPITDPDNIPVRNINGSHCGVVGGLVALTLNTVRISFDAEGNVQENRVIGARLRFDLEIAKAIRDQLNIQIAVLSPPTDAKPN